MPRRPPFFMSKRKILFSLLFVIHLFIPVLANLDPLASGIMISYGRLTGLAKRWTFFPNVQDSEFVMYFTGDQRIIPGNISRDNWFIQNFVNGNHIDFYATLPKNPERLLGYMEFLCRSYGPREVRAELIIRPLLTKSTEERKTFKTLACR